MTASAVASNDCEIVRPSAFAVFRFQAKEFVELGGLVSFGDSIPDRFRKAAVYVDRILERAKPGDLAVKQPSTVELAINETTAKALDLGIPAPPKMRAEIVP